MFINKLKNKENIRQPKPTGILITDADLVNISSVPKGITSYTAPFNRIAIEELGRKTVANMIMLGYIAEKTKIISFNFLKKAIYDLVLKRTLELSFKALERGKNIAK